MVFKVPMKAIAFGRDKANRNKMLPMKFWIVDSLFKIAVIDFILV